MLQPAVDFLTLLTEKLPPPTGRAHAIIVRDGKMVLILNRGEGRLYELSFSHFTDSVETLVESIAKAMDETPSPEDLEACRLEPSPSPS